MCTIGVTSHQERIIVFKQCDLQKKVTFYKPEIRNEIDNIQYFAFTRQNSEGLWAGVNNYGVCFVAADSYMQGKPVSTYERHGGGASASDIFTKYEQIVSQCKNAKQAVEMMCAFYRTFDEPDILMICDRTHQFFMETNQRNPLVVQLFEKNFEQNKYFVSTNHFRFLHGGITFPENHSTYLRLQRAESILQQKPNEAGVNELLKDQYYGPSVLSVCRENRVCPEGEEGYFTQATAYFVLEKDIRKQIQANYQINDNPRYNSLYSDYPFKI